MPSALDRIDIAPPRDAGTLRSLGLALLIHAALITALTWGVNWKRTDTAATFGAELWASAPPEAAAVVTPPPTALPLPAPVVKQAPEQTPAEQTPNVDIALAQEKKRKQLKDQQAANEAQQAKKANEKLAQDKAKLVQAQADKAKLVKADQLKAEQAKADVQKSRQAQQATQQATTALRDDNMKRLNDLMTKAGGSPQGDSTSRASAGGKGSSKTYDAIANAAIMPNVVFTDAIEGNPVALVEVRVTSDGTITSSKVVQPSGNKNWDNAVLNGLARTRVMPKDVDGKLPDTIFILSLRPRF